MALVKQESADRKLARELRASEKRTEQAHQAAVKKDLKLARKLSREDNAPPEASLRMMLRAKLGALRADLTNRRATPARARPALSSPTRLPPARRRMEAAPRSSTTVS